MCSMLSAQVDKLRERAKELRSLAPNPAVPYLVPSTKETMALAMRSAASEMEDAADIIWDLRDMVHHERNENTKLRELCKELYECSRQIGCDKCGYKDGCVMFDRMAQLRIEVDE